MNILSIEFRKNWSWGLTFDAMQNISEHNIKRVFMDDKDKIPENGYDVVLGQNVTLLKRFKERLRTLCRLGGNYNFDKMDGIEPLLDEMAKCHALIATNKKLYEIAKSVNPNTYLIPNGIDLNEWKQPTVFYGRKFTVGFCANISTDHYRLYKGYDFVSKACANLGFELKTALYNNKQIPHEEMQRRFYHVIDVLVHPTLGEGSSSCLMEACACGVPIITTREAGFHGELMQDMVDVLFCERTVASIQSKLLLLRTDSALRMFLGGNARKFAEQHHDVKKIALQYEQIFQECYDYNKNIGE